MNAMLPGFRECGECGVIWQGPVRRWQKFVVDGRAVSRPLCPTCADRRKRAEKGEGEENRWRSR